jgi:hypothetical protein
MSWLPTKEIVSKRDLGSDGRPFVRHLASASWQARLEREREREREGGRIKQEDISCTADKTTRIKAGGSKAGKHKFRHAPRRQVRARLFIRTRPQVPKQKGEYVETADAANNRRHTSLARLLACSPKNVSCWKL